MEVGLVVQNFNGGILIDADGFTGVEGLYAAGEASGGVHGSDRPGGNNLIDTQVFGYRAGRAAAGHAAEAAERRAASRGLPDPVIEPPSDADKKLMDRMADLYYSNMTIIRSAKGLKEVLDAIEQSRKRRQRSSSRTASLRARSSRVPRWRVKRAGGRTTGRIFPQPTPDWEKKDRCLTAAGRLARR